MIITALVTKYIKPKLSERVLKIFSICSVVILLIIIATIFFTVFFK